MKIGGIIPLSLLDYPQKPTIVVFTSGCNLRCPFCHNGELVTGSEGIDEDEVFQLLNRKIGKLDAVCISGGEPTIHDDLDEFIEGIRALGFSVKLDTNGSRPEMLERLLTRELLNYVAIDIKSSPNRYRDATGGKLDFAVVAEAVAKVKVSKIPYELRTTAVPGIVDLEDIAMIAQELGTVERFALQQFRSKKTLDPSFRGTRTYPQSWFEKARELLQGKAAEVLVRGI